MKIQGNTTDCTFAKHSRVYQRLLVGHTTGAWRRVGEWGWVGVVSVLALLIYLGSPTLLHPGPHPPPSTLSPSCPCGHTLRQCPQGDCYLPHEAGNMTFEHLPPTIKLGGTVQTWQHSPRDKLMSTLHTQFWVWSGQGFKFSLCSCLIIIILKPV
jgi:hypothetical protein